MNSVREGHMGSWKYHPCQTGTWQPQTHASASGDRAESQNPHLCPAEARHPFLSCWSRTNRDRRENKYVHNLLPVTIATQLHRGLWEAAEKVPPTPCQQRPREGPESAALLALTRNHSQLGYSGRPGLPPLMWKKQSKPHPPEKH